MNENGSVLKAHNLSKTYSARRVVNDVSFDIKTGEVVGLFGPNGAGKTTTFYSVIGFIRPDTGKITVDDEDITHMPMFMRARKGITYLPQEPSIFKKLSVADNLRSILEFHEVDREVIEHKVQELLETFKLEQLSGNNADLLSGGERRRLEVARALMMSPRFILLDEPFSGIDPISVADLKKIVNGLKKRGIGILLSDHNVRESLPICDRAFIMSDGKVILEGDPSEIVKNKIVREVYLGEEFYLDVGT
ncbi:MAG: transporter related [Deltaproteobacteria bacterium]|jgi:lipopolysaccharide export system ATP-binding protein|nr:transporter related [Deltaproteobacteria bacterium]